jgi:D-alanyl-D-alanine carboxypeptidase
VDISDPSGRGKDLFDDALSNPALQLSNATVAALPLAFAAERHYRWADEEQPTMETSDSGAALVAKVWAELGIPSSHGGARHLPFYADATDLVSVGLDIYGRERHLTPRAAERWTTLAAAASAEGISLLLVSAYRSLEYQRQIFERKLKAGELLENILKVNVPPGHSEHHTGRAVDLTTPGCPPLVEQFETTEAFAWLVRHAERFDFSLSYPRDNPFGVAYEPWHWALKADGIEVR